MWRVPDSDARTYPETSFWLGYDQEHNLVLKDEDVIWLCSMPLWRVVCNVEDCRWIELFSPVQSRKFYMKQFSDQALDSLVPFCDRSITTSRDANRQEDAMV